MPSQDSSNDGDVRYTYNFAPGNYGLVYRADTSPPSTAVAGTDENGAPRTDGEETQEPESSSQLQYRLQAMKWGLIPFWTKKNPDYGSMMKTINCRDDSLAQTGGLWQHSKKKHRCVVIAQGFYEWLKKNNGKEKIPHYVKRKDGQLMCFAGLWDRVEYEDAENELFTYTIVTTSSNKQLGFLHDRMPVILDNGSKDMFTWLDPTRQEWTKELQSLLEPYQGELQCYPVPKDVGKVGNDSPNFIIPLQENKQSINNFFAHQKGKTGKVDSRHSDHPDKQSPISKVDADEQNGQFQAYTRLAEINDDKLKSTTGKRSAETGDVDGDLHQPADKRSRTQITPQSSPTKSNTNTLKGTPTARKKASPIKSSSGKHAAGDGSMKITSFFKT